MWNSPSVLPLNMNPAQQHLPSSDELCFTALEQAVIDSRAREAKTEQRIEMLLNGFLKLERFMTEQQTPPTLRKSPPLTSSLSNPPQLDDPLHQHYQQNMTEIAPKAWPFSRHVKPIYDFVRILSHVTKQKSPGLYPI